MWESPAATTQTAGRAHLARTTPYLIHPIAREQGSNPLTGAGNLADFDCSASFSGCYPSNIAFNTVQPHLKLVEVFGSRGSVLHRQLRHGLESYFHFPTESLELGVFTSRSGKSLLKARNNKIRSSNSQSISLSITFSSSLLRLRTRTYRE